MSLTALIKETAVELGFDLVGVAPAERSPHADAYAGWVEAGYAAEMGYMQRDAARRQNPQRLLAGAKSVVVVGLSYYCGEPPVSVWNDPARGRLARYAWGGDYHDHMKPALERLAEFISQRGRREVHHRVCVDTAPILERDLAASAGLGFIGRNACLIHPLLGSYLFLGEIVVDINLDFDLPATADGAELALVPETCGHSARVVRARGRTTLGECGQCHRCLDVCPTGALLAPYILDSNRCLSYLTIENKGPIPMGLRPALGNWIFGCDLCQSVCPWPRRYARRSAGVTYSGDPDRIAPPLLDLMSLNEAEFENRFRHTPLWRSKRQGILRNVAVALGNWGHDAAVPVLEHAYRQDNPLIRDHAEWALRQIRNRAM